MHALEIGSAGQVAFASRKEPAWHLLGTVFDEAEAVTTSQMLAKAYLNNWHVRLEELALATGQSAEWVQEQFAVVRDNPFTPGDVDVLSIVGGRYKIVQNEDLFAFGDNLLDGGGQWETAGSIKGGRQVFGSLLLPKEIVIDGQGANDKIKTYLLVHTSHDGTVGVQAATTPVRVVCQNTLNYALAGVKQSFKMRHTATIEGRIQSAREAMALSFAYADAFEAEAKALYAKSMTTAEFHKVALSLYPAPVEDKKGSKTRHDNKIDLLTSLFTGVPFVEGAPNTSANIAGTAWAGLNALTERLDWYRTPRNGEFASVAEAASGFSTVVNAEKADIRRAVLTFANA